MSINGGFLLLLCAISLADILILEANAEGLLWEDWDRRQVCSPGEYLVPETESELQEIVVRKVKGEGRQLKVVGAGHSFSSIALCGDGSVVVSLDKLNKIVRVEGTSVTVQGGMRLHILNSELEARNLSLTNMGATCEQSIAGATQTGTHGTGKTLGSMSTQIIGMKLLLANGTFITAKKGGLNHDILKSAAVGLGALGIVTQLTLKTEALFYLNLTKITMPLDALLSSLPNLMERYERLQWYWNPPDEENATLVLRERVDAIPPKAEGCWNGAAHLGEPEQLFGAASSYSSSTCIDVSYKALCGSRAHYHARNLYTEMEMFVPQHVIPELIRDFRQFQSKVLPQHNKSLFVGVRYVSADGITMSPQNGRSNAVVSQIVTGPSKTETGDFDDFSLYARELERIAESSYHGRPHWGKMNWATKESILRGYGNANLNAFLDLRAKLDPHGYFLNDYLKERFDV